MCAKDLDVKTHLAPLQGMRSFFTVMIAFLCTSFAKKINLNDNIQPHGQVTSLLPLIV